MLNRFRQLCGTMTYRDMVDVSTVISEALPDCAQPEDVAKVLTNLPGDSEDNQQENTNRLLSHLFSRKRTITIQPESHPAGGTLFKIMCPTVDGAVVLESNIREGLSQLLDTLTVLQAFKDG